MSGEKEVYRTPNVRTPTLRQLGDIAKKWGLELTDEELGVYQGFIADRIFEYDIVDKYAEPLLPTKYPRTPGYRPPPEENEYNAWYYKTDIKGAPSGPLAGKTFAIKDMVAVAGVPMMNGSKLLEGHVPEYDATVITRILDAGGRILGKAVCEDMCCCGSSYTTSKGTCLNFHDKTRSAAGSSSGSGVLVAAGEVDMALAGDQGGSIRIPACWNGVVGFKPTWGLVPYTGGHDIEPRIGHLGPITRTVKDCALFLEVIAGYDDGLDARQPCNPATTQVPKYTEKLTGKIEGMKIGIMLEGFDDAEPDVEKMVKEAAHKLASAGATVEEVSVPIHRVDSMAIWRTIALEGGYHHLFGGGGIHFGNKTFQMTTTNDHWAKNVQTRPNDMSITAKYVLLQGTYMKENYGNHFYMKASNVARTLTKEYDKALEKYNVLIMPTIKFKAPKLPKVGATLKEQMDDALSMNFNTAPFNATGHPALNINAGFSEKLPVGMMIVGKHWDETTILNVAEAYERIRDA